MNKSIKERMTAIRTLIESGHKSEALELCQTEIDCAEGADAAPFIFQMAMLSFYSNDEGLGLQLLERAHQIDPNTREYAEALANACTRLGHLADGLYYAKLTLALRSNPTVSDFVPKDMTSYRASLDNVGLSLHDLRAQTAFRLGKFDEAIEQASQELRINPKNVKCMTIIAESMLARGMGYSAVSILKGALHVEPRNGLLHTLLAEALLATGQHDSALKHQEFALTGLPEDEDEEEKVLARLAGSALIQSDNNWPAAKQFLAHYQDLVGSPRRACKAAVARQGLLGLMWDQCHQGPLTDFVIPVIRNIENTVLYNLGIRKDAYSEIMRNSVTRPRVSVGVDQSTLGRIILGDGLSGLINFCAPSEAASFPYFTNEVRPMTIHWLNMPMLDRLPNADLVIAGPETADIDEANYGAENVILLDQLVAYGFPQSVGEAEMVTPLPRDERGYPMFGMIGDFSRLSLDTVALAARVLLGTRNSRLMLGGRVSWEPDAIERITDLFGGYGLSDRIHFQEAGEDGTDALTDFYHQIDVLLDSSPVSGDRDIAHALWLGVPTVTLRGKRRCGRLGASILHAAGKTGWIAATPEDFTAIAEGLATLTTLGDVRAQLRDQVLASPLADAAGLARQMVEHLRMRMFLLQ